MFKGSFGPFKGIAVTAFGKTVRDYGAFNSVAGSNLLAMKLKQDRHGAFFVILRMRDGGTRLYTPLTIDQAKELRSALGDAIAFPAG